MLIIVMKITLNSVTLMVTSPITNIKSTPVGLGCSFISISGAKTLEKSLSCCFGSFKIDKNFEIIFQKK